MKEVGSHLLGFDDASDELRSFGVLDKVFARYAGEKRSFHGTRRDRVDTYSALSTLYTPHNQHLLDQKYRPDMLGGDWHLPNDYVY